MRHWVPALLLIASCRSVYEGSPENYRRFLDSNPPEGLTVNFFEVQNGDAFYVTEIAGAVQITSDGARVRTVSFSDTFRGT